MQSKSETSKFRTENMRKAGILHYLFRDMLKHLVFCFVFSLYFGGTQVLVCEIALISVVLLFENVYGDFFSKEKLVIWYGKNLATWNI